MTKEKMILGAILATSLYACSDSSSNTSAVKEGGVPPPTPAVPTAKSTPLDRLNFIQDQCSSNAPNMSAVQESVLELVKISSPTQETVKELLRLCGKTEVSQGTPWHPSRPTGGESIARSQFTAEVMTTLNKKQK